MRALPILASLVGIALGLAAIFRPEPEPEPFAPISIERPLKVLDVTVPQNEPVVFQTVLCNVSDDPVVSEVTNTYVNVDTGEVLREPTGTLPLPANTCLDQDFPVPLPPMITPGRWALRGSLRAELRDDQVVCESDDDCESRVVVVDSQTVVYDSVEFIVE